MACDGYLITLSSEYYQIKERRMEAVEVTPPYVKISMTLQCIIQLKKTLVKSSASPRLMAVTLRGGNSDFKVRFSLSVYMYHRVPNRMHPSLCVWAFPRAISILLVPSWMIPPLTWSWRFVHHNL